MAPGKSEPAKPNNNFKTNMKKLLFAAMAVFAMSFASCGDGAKAAAEVSTDSVAVDSVAAADTVSADSAAAEIAVVDAE